MTKQHRIRVIARPDEVGEIEAMAIKEGLRLERITPRAIDPGSITLVLIGAVAAIAAVQTAIETYRGGQVIDLRPEAPAPFYRSRQLHYGLVVVMADSGAIQVTVFEPREMFGKVVELLIAALGGTQGGSNLRARVEDAMRELPEGEVEILDTVQP